MRLEVTWWGHASATVSGVAVDPLLVDRLFHLVRSAPTPPPAATEADLVLVSHLHQDHCHAPSLARFAPDVPVVVPAGGGRYAGPRAVEVSPGDELDLAGVHVEVLAASHDGRRHPLSRTQAPALGFRVTTGAGSWWYPGDSDLRDDMADVDPVDLALVPVGGWGPTLGDGHMDPTEAAAAVGRVGARWAVPVHWGTFWPAGLRRVARANHHRLFTTPGARFAEAMAGSATEAVVLAPGERAVR